MCVSIPEIFLRSSPIQFRSFTSRSVKRHSIGHLVRELGLAGESEGRDVVPNFQIGDGKDSLHCFCGSLNPENRE